MNKIILLCSILCSVIGVAQFDSLNSIKVPHSVSVSSALNWRDFIEPNEPRPGLFGLSSLKDPKAKGLLVSVGTIRTLVIYAWADHISHLWMADIDERIVQFNRTHLNFIKCIADEHPGDFHLQRVRYIANLHRVDVSSAELLKLAQNKNFSAQNMREIIDQVEGPDLKNKFIENSCLNKAFNESRALDYMASYNTFNTMFKYQSVEGERFYWDDELQWKKIIDGIANNTIAVSRLNIAPTSSVDNDDLNLMLNFIETSGLNWGILDVSNIPTFHHRQSKANKPWAEFLKNARTKPYKVLVTHQKSCLFEYWTQDFDRFLYYLCPDLALE